MSERVNISIPTDLLERIDAAAAGEGLTRSGYLRAAARGRLVGTGMVRETPTVYAPAAGPGVDGFTAARSPQQAASLLRAFFAAREDVVAAYLFGSVAAGTAGPTSDLDVAVLLPDHLTAAERWETGIELATRIGVVFGTNEVDVVVLNDAPESLGRTVVLTGLLVAGQHSARRATFEAGARAGADAADGAEPQLWDELKTRLGLHGDLPSDG
jgi:hypothetical protein